MSKCFKVKVSLAACDTVWLLRYSCYLFSYVENIHVHGRWAANFVLYGALVVTLAMLLRLINCHIIFSRYVKRPPMLLLFSGFFCMFHCIFMLPFIGA